MKSVFKVLGMSACLLTVAVFATGLTSDTMAQNASSGLGVPLNATGAESSPEVMNNTLTAGVGPENETVITK